jgi:decaprenylphospho-beta-D-erythro-pentofuranosid-2-ulose 2-reductase
LKNRRRIVIVGATSSIAEHCARYWVSNESVDITLVGRDTDRTERIALDLKVRSPESIIRTRQCDFYDPEAIQLLVDGIVVQGRVDIVLIAHGSLPFQSNCENDLSQCKCALEINGISPVLFAEAFAKYLEKSGHGTLALIGSVAGDRGRKSNYVYGAAKGMVDIYAQGLQHRFAGMKVKTLLIKPGPTDTPMTAHLKNQGMKLAAVEDVAKNIIDSIGQGKAVLYTPRKWWLIMLIIRHLPRYVFNKLNI